MKACYGHTEGAAGLQGALCSVLSMQMAAAPPVMHLRNLNPYVSAALADWSTTKNLQAFTPRVRACLAFWQSQILKRPQICLRGRKVASKLQCKSPDPSETFRTCLSCGLNSKESPLWPTSLGSYVLYICPVAPFKQPFKGRTILLYRRSVLSITQGKEQLVV